MLRHWEPLNKPSNCIHKQIKLSIYEMYFAYEWIFHCFYNLNILSCLYSHTRSKKISSAGLGLCMYFTPNTKNRPTSKGTLCLWTRSLSAPVAKFVPFMHWVFDNPLKWCSSAYLCRHTKNPTVFHWHTVILYCVLSLPFHKVTLAVPTTEDATCLTYHSNPFFHWRTSPWKHITIIAGVCTALFHTHHDYWIHTWECCKIACIVTLSVSSIKRSDWIYS